MRFAETKPSPSLVLLLLVKVDLGIERATDQTFPRETVDSGDCSKMLQAAELAGHNTLCTPWTSSSMTGRTPLAVTQVNLAWQQCCLEDASLSIMTSRAEELLNNLWLVLSKHCSTPQLAFRSGEEHDDQQLTCRCAPLYNDF